jgi:sulfonate transport system ATP-binding protein
MAQLIEQLTRSASATASASRSAADSSAVHIRALTRSFGERVVLDEIELDIAPGQFVALLGHSGSGKSTLLRAIAGLDHNVSGTGEIRAPGRISVAFQDSRLLPWRRVLDNVVLGARGGASAGERGRDRSRGRLRAPDAAGRGRAALAEVGLAGREQAWPRELSGGEAQRAALARSLVWEPELLLADEPFGALDALTRIKMHALLRELWTRHRPSVLLVTHDVDEAIVLADRVLVLDHGRIGLDLPVDLPHPRTYRDPQVAEYRELLLAALGVQEDVIHPGHPRSAPVSPTTPTSPTSASVPAPAPRSETDQPTDATARPAAV